MFGAAQRSTGKLGMSISVSDSVCWKALNSSYPCPQLNQYFKPRPLTIEKSIYSETLNLTRLALLTMGVAERQTFSSLTQFFSLSLELAATEQRFESVMGHSVS